MTVIRLRAMKQDEGRVLANTYASLTAAARGQRTTELERGGTVPNGLVGDGCGWVGERFPTNVYHE